MDALDQGQVTAAPEAHSNGAANPRLRIAYLLSQYPAVSHTFFLQEVLGLRARGIHIETASINRPDRPIATLAQEEAREARSTQYIKSGNWLRTLVELAGIAFTRPGVVWRGVALVCGLPGLTLRQRGLWLFYLAEAMLVGRWMQRSGLDHLHVHFGGAVASVGMLVSHAWSLPYSLTIHGPEELLNVDRYRLREKIEQASFVFCISDFCRSQLCQLTSPASWSKFAVVRLGVDPFVLRPSLRPPEPTLRTTERPLELVCIGRLVPAKGHYILLQALDQLRRRGVRLRATLIGAGPERPVLESFVRTNGLQHQVVFTSALSHAETLDTLRKADLFALASFAEGIPVALMEAMSLGLPCVSTTVAGIPELIRNEIDGLLVPPANVAALADALASLAEDPGLRKRLGSSGRQRIISDYNLPLNQENLARCLEERMLAARSPAGTESAEPTTGANGSA